MQVLHSLYQTHMPCKHAISNQYRACTGPMLTASAQYWHIMASLWGSLLFGYNLPKIISSWLIFLKKGMSKIQTGRNILWISFVLSVGNLSFVYILMYNFGCVCIYWCIILACFFVTAQRSMGRGHWLVVEVLRVDGWARQMSHVHGERIRPTGGQSETG